MACGRCVVLAIVGGGCIGPTPDLDYDASTGEATMTSASSSSPSSSSSTSTTAMSTTPVSDTLPPDTSSSEDTSTGGSSTSSPASTTSGTDTDEPPTEHGPCSPVPSALSLERVGSQWIASNDEIAAAFDADENSMLSSLEDPELPVELLHTADEPHERLAGIGYFVAVDADEYSWRGSDATLTVLEAGPAVVRIQVDWVTDDAITEAGLSGTTVYTIVPDGRLVRDESVTLDHEGTADEAWFTAYLALDVGLFARVQTNFPLDCADPKTPMECPVGEESPGVGPTIHGSGMFGVDAWICATDDGSERSVSWMVEADSASAGAVEAARLSEYHSLAGGYSLAMQYDWHRQHVVAADTYGIHTLTFLDADDEDPCACSLQHFDAYGTPPTVDPNGTTSFLEYRSEGAYFDVGVADSPVELTFTGGAIPPTMLLRLQGASTVTAVELDDEPLEEGVDYLAQTGMQADTAWLYLARPVATNGMLALHTE